MWLSSSSMKRFELTSGTTAEDYLEELDKALKVAESRFQPQLIVYNAGMDILDGDLLGKLKVSPEGVSIRDKKIFRLAKNQNVPILMLTSDVYPLRRLCEIKCSSYSRFNHQSHTEKLDRIRFCQPDIINQSLPSEAVLLKVDARRFFKYQSFCHDVTIMRQSLPVFDNP